MPHLLMLEEVLKRFVFPSAFVSEWEKKERMHTSWFTAETYLLEEGSGRAKMGYLFGPVSC